MNPFRRYRHYEKGEFFCVFADTAAGGVDYCAVQFLSKTKLDVPVVYHAQVIATEMTPVLHTELERIHDETGVQPVIAYEINNGAIFELERLSALNRLQKYKIYQMKQGQGTTDPTELSGKLGWNTNSASRPAMLTALKDAIDNQLITIYDRPTVTEMFSFIVKQTNTTWKAQAESGAHDDLIMSLAGAWQMYATENPPKKLQTHRKRPPKLKLHVR